MLPSWISAPNASHRRIAPLDIETLGEPERAPSPKPTLAPIGPVGGSPVERSVTPPATKSGIGSLQSVAASMRTSVSEGAPKRGSIVERPSFAADVMGQNSPFRYEDSFKSPKLPSYAHIATAKSSSDRLGSKTVTLPKDPLRWDIPLQYGRRLHLPDEAEGPKFTDPSSFTKTASPYISIVKNEDCISMAMTEALATVPIVNSEPIMIPISKLGFNTSLTNKSTLKQVYPLLSAPQLGTLLLYLARIGDAESVGLLSQSSKINVNLTDDEGRSPLCYACIGGHLTCANHLYKNGANVNLIDKVGRTPLFHAAYFGHAELVRSLLSWGADVTHTDLNGKNALHYAVFSDNIKVTTNILSPSKRSFFSWKRPIVNGGLLYATDRDGLTPLIWASYIGQYQQVQHIVSQSPATVSFADSEGMNPLHWCARNHHGRAAEILISASRKLLEKKTLSGRSPIHLAIAEGNTILAELFLRQQPRAVNASDRDRRTPLHYAAAFGHLACIHSLCRQGADLDLQDVKGATALHYAVKGNFADIVHLLLKKGARTYVKDVDGRDPVLWAVLEGDLDLVKAMVNHGASLQSVDNHGWDALHIAAVAGAYPICQFLLRADIPIDTKDDREHSAMMKAIALGWKDIVHSLLENGANVNDVDSEGRSPLHWAVSRNSVEVVGLLLEFGVLVDIVDDSGREAIHEAATNGYDDIIQKIAAAGGFPDLPDIEGLTPLHLASSKGHHVVCATLYRLGAPINPLDLHMQRRTPLDFAMEKNHTKCVQFLRDKGGLTGEEIRSLAATAIQTSWRRFNVQLQVRASPQYRSLLRKWGVKKNKAAVKIQAWFRGALQRRRYKQRLHLDKMSAVRNHEILLTLEELDRAVREREAAEKERLQAEDDRRQAESERAETLKLKKKMIDARRQVALDYKQTMYEKRDSLGGIGIGKFTSKLVKNAAAITIQRAWHDHKIKNLPATPDPMLESPKVTTASAQAKRKEASLVRRPSLFKATLPGISSLENSLDNLPKRATPTGFIRQPVPKDNKVQAAMAKFQDVNEPDSYFLISRGTTPNRSQSDVIDDRTPSNGVGPKTTPGGTLRNLASNTPSPDIARAVTPEPPRAGTMKRRISFSTFEGRAPDSGRQSTASIPRTYVDADGKPMRIPLPSSKPTHAPGFPSLEHLHQNARVPSLDQFGNRTTGTPGPSTPTRPGGQQSQYFTSSNYKSNMQSQNSVASGGGGGATPPVDVPMTPRGYDEIGFHTMRRHSVNKF